MRVNGATIRRAAVHLGLLLASGVAGLALCEVSLRLFYPKYRHLAEAQFHTDAMRIWARTPNYRDWRRHPDTYVTYSLHHNNLALRQHRDFSAADLATATNIGVFGDSFTENTGMPVQFSFTEPLDYLLNQSGGRFNVLNFGVGSYGPGQSLLHYEHFRYVEDLDHVFYVYYENDLQNIYETGLFHLDETGHLVRNEALRESWWTPLIRRLHISYLVLDVRQRWASSTAETATSAELLRSQEFERVQAIRAARSIRIRRRDHGSQQNNIAIFRQLIRRWKHLAEDNGSTFSVVLLPSLLSSLQRQPVVVDLLNAEDVAFIDLDACFGNHDPAYHDRAWAQSSYRFRNDSHWNEAGNQLAALCLYRFLEKKMGLPHLSEERLWGAISRYYAAFEGGVPLKTGGEGEGAVSLEAAAAIREKYLALDMSTPSKEEFTKSATQPDKRIVASDFDVYFHQNHLFYVREDCRQANLGAPFFLHMIPIDERHLRENRRQLGFNRRTFKWSLLHGYTFGRHGCTIKIPLKYPVRYIQTGQYVPDEGRLWEGAAWIGRTGSGEERPEFPVAAGKRIIRSDFDVYLDGRQLVYHKADCGPADRAARLFLHVTSVDETDLPPKRTPRGFDNLDFRHPDVFNIDEFGCTSTQRLPPYAIGRIRTGQYMPGRGPLWEGKFAMKEDVLGQD